MTKRRGQITVAAIGAVLLGCGLVAALKLRSRAIAVPSVANSEQTVSIDQDELRERIYGLRWIAYAPTNFNPNASPPVKPPDESIRADLLVLHRAGFQGLVLYGADLVSIPRIAEEVGFRGILLGVWSPGNQTELAQAREAAKSAIVLGIIVGNEGLTFARYDLPTLRTAMEQVRRETGKPVSTTEIIERYYNTPELMEWSDFLAVNAHPFHHGIREPRAAVDWTESAYRNLSVLTAKPLVFKEVGLPSSVGRELSQEAQAKYYSLLRLTNVKFVYFESFDGDGWKTWAPTEGHWGLWFSDRRPKLAARALIAQAAP